MQLLNYEKYTTKRLYNELNNTAIKLKALKIKEKNIKKILSKREKEPSTRLKKAILEIKNGESTRYNSVEEMMKDLENV